MYKAAPPSIQSYNNHSLPPRLKPKRIQQTISIRLLKLRRRGLLLVRRTAILLNLVLIILPLVFLLVSIRLRPIRLNRRPIHEPIQCRRHAALLRRQIRNDEAAAPLEQLPRVDIVRGDGAGRALEAVRGMVRQRRRQRRERRLLRLEELPRPDQVEREEVAAHALVEARRVHDELPLGARRHGEGAAEGLEGLFAELAVQDDEGGVVCEEELGLQRRGVGRGEQAGEGRDEGADGDVALAEHPEGPSGYPAVAFHDGVWQDLFVDEFAEDGPVVALVDSGDGNG